MTHWLAGSQVPRQRWETEPAPQVVSVEFDFGHHDGEPGPGPQSPGFSGTLSGLRSFLNAWKVKRKGSRLL